MPTPSFLPGKRSLGLPWKHYLSPRHPGVTLLLLCLATTTLVQVLTGAPRPGKPVPAARSLHVSPTGDDANPGTPERPLRTLQHARDLVRPMNQNMTGDIR